MNLCRVVTSIGYQMSERSRKTKVWRDQTKLKMVKSMGGKCCICGYDKHNAALAFHHINPDEKSFSFGTVIANPRKWEIIAEELKKCVLVCHNCHSEIHAGITSIPENPPKYNEAEVPIKIHKTHTPCVVCGKAKKDSYKTCSKECSSKHRRKVDWKEEDLMAVVNRAARAQVIGEKYGVTGNAVIRKIKTMGLHDQYVANKKINLPKICEKCGSALYKNTWGRLCKKCFCENKATPFLTPN